MLCAGFFTRTKPAGFGSTPSVSELFLYFSVFLFYNLKVTFLKLSKQFSWWAFSHGSRISRHGFYVSFLHKLHKKPNIFFEATVLQTVEINLFWSILAKTTKIAPQSPEFKIGSVVPSRFLLISDPVILLVP